MTERWTIQGAATALGAELVVASDDVDAELELGAASNDARTVVPGGLFVALAGSTTHGVAFAQQAAHSGAGAILVGSDAPHDGLDALAAILPVIVAHDDALAAIGRLARLWRERCGWRVVGITGSSGKTSTKDLLASLCAPSRSVVASIANNNNELGVPLTLLRAEPETDLVICEMGMRARGEIEYLCDIASPDIGIITGAGSAHIELLGSLEAIAAAKAELLAGIADGGVGIVPADQPQFEQLARVLPAQIMHFGTADGDIWADPVETSGDGIRGVLRTVVGDAIGFALPLLGVHQARNLAAASCAIVAMDGSLDALDDIDWSTVRLSSGRGDRTELSGGGVLVDDAYNANPESMVAALDTLAAIPATRHVALLGAMAELGVHAPPMHRMVGEAAARVGVDVLVVLVSTDACREIAAGYRDAGGTRAVVLEAAPAATLAVQIEALLEPGDAVLCKASNSARLHEVAQALREQVAVQEHAHQ